MAAPERSILSPFPQTPSLSVSEERLWPHTNPTSLSKERLWSLENGTSVAQPSQIDLKRLRQALLKVQLAKAQTEGPGSTEVFELRKKNETLLAEDVVLKEKLIKSNDDANDHLTLVI